MTELVQYKALLKAELYNVFGNKQWRNQRINRKTASKLGVGVILAIACVAIVVWLSATASTLTVASVEYGVEREVLDLLFLIGQSVVFFFGLVTGISTLYFSRDNALLATLPVRPTVRFAAKYTVLYLGELLFSGITFLPMTLSYAVTLSVLGKGVAWYFYPFTILNALLIPALPLLLISILAVPVVALYNALRRTRWGSIATRLLGIVGVLAIYGVMMAISTLSSAGDGDPTMLINAMNGIHKATPFNYLMVEAMWGVHPLGYFFAYLAEMLAIALVALGLAALYYRRGLQSVLEGDGAAPKTGKKKREVGRFGAKNTEDGQSTGFFKTFLYKEWKTLSATPSLFISAAISVIMVPIIAVILSLSWSGMGEDAQSVELMDFMLVGVLMMMGMGMSGGSVLGMIGISREGKTMLYLKTMPIPIREFLKAKLALPLLFSGISALVIAVTLSVSVSVFSPTVLIGTMLVLILHAYGMACIGLRNDLKNPNLNWTNINELTGNNMRVVKPMLIGMGIGFLQVIFGVISGVILINFLYREWVFVIYYTLALIPAGVLAFVGDKRLRRDALGFYERIGE